MVPDFTAYEFRSTWSVAAPPEHAYRVLRRVDLYPLWWPEVKQAAQISEQSYDLICKSVLPYELRFTILRLKEEPGVLEVGMAGDLEGFSRWSIEGSSTGSSCLFEEEVVTNKRMLNLLAPAARPLFIANHWFMMRHGEAGLRTFMAGYVMGSET